MLKRCASLILIAFLVTGCLHHGRKSSIPPAEASGSRTQQFRPVSTFNQVDAEGRINLNLHTGYKKPQVVLMGDARDLAQVKVQVNQGTLHISLGSGYPRYGDVSADIQGRFLNKLRYIGAGVIKGNQLNTSYLSIYLENQGTTQLGGYIGLRQLVVNGGGLTQISGISSPYLEINFKGNPKVQLVGVANISKLDLEGTGWLSLYWVKSDNLRIKAKKGAKIQLAGSVNRLEVELWGMSRFKGRYLRAQRSFVKTHGRSVAEISSVNHQSTLASDASDIFYYNLSKTRVDFMAYNGAVLDMRDWEAPELKDFTQYNKQFP
ncbi:MAG: GIN domain-containing protein [Legionellales bacterium]